MSARPPRTSPVPAVSVLVTVRDGSRWLAQALSSAQAQERPAAGRFEIIVVDDGSRDESLLIAQSFARFYPALFRVFAGSGQGRAEALIEAHARALGEHIVWLDADDWLLPGALVHLDAALRSASSKVGMIYGRHLSATPNGEIEGLGRRCVPEFTKERLLEAFITHHPRIYKRSAYDTVGGIDPHYKCAMDYKLCLDLAERFDIEKIDRTLYVYRHNPKGISQSRKDEQTAFARQAIAESKNRVKLNSHALL